MTVLLWILTGLSLYGVVLNIRRNRACFFVWAVTNSSWAAVDFQAGLYAQAALFTVYFAMACWGIVAWKTKDAVNPNHRPINR